MSALAVDAVTDNACPARKTSVSGNETANGSGNFPPSVSHNAYVTLAGFALTWARDGWVSCSICGGKSYKQHCVTCHQQPEYRTSAHNGEDYPKQADHDSCYACGRCQAPGYRGSYCSSTCRVRAHNYYHHTTAGQVKLAEQKARSEAFMARLGTVPEPNRRVGLSASLGETCGQCGTNFAAGETAYLSTRNWNGGHRRNVRCFACAKPGEARPGVWRGPLPCRGCQRPIVYISRIEPHYRRREAGGSWIACSTRCTRRAYNQKPSQEREPLDCVVCHERIDTRRRDARYCSPACRQKAYRGRKPDSASGLIGASE